MADPLLTSLCSICHLNSPKYTCPRCAQRTCSLACARRHKAWASCSGVRDPTAYVPASRLRTPAGVDHDYNFLSAIERARERRQKEVVEERGIFGEGELRSLLLVRPQQQQQGGEAERRGVPPSQKRRGPPWKRGGEAADEGATAGSGLDRKIRKRLELMDVRVVEMPRGMARQKENTTSWNRRTNKVNWAVEWMVHDESGACTRIRHKALETVPLYQAVVSSLGWHRKGLEKRDAADDDDDDDGPPKKKRRRGPLIQEVGDEVTASPYGAMQNPESAAWLPAAYPAQNPFTGTWARERTPVMTSWAADEEAETKRRSRFFLLAPLTPAGQPKELVPVDAEETLGTALKGRTVLEFPTVYVLPPSPASSIGAGTLPPGHVLGSTERRTQPAQKRKAHEEPPRQHGKGPQLKRRGAALGNDQRRGRQAARANDDAEEGEVNSGGEEARAAAPAHVDDDDMTSSEGETTSSSDESSDVESEEEADEQHRAEEREAGTDRHKSGLVDYESDSAAGESDGEEDPDVGELRVDNPELLQGAVREIVNLLT
ncbi:Box C/D snoRNA protein 1 [Pleurostoma richardsiae]|uniref:Box C/D snoRNA protein 1 n=1 Tax=Pleurostoma richardsiae TaxID=41990 RepID=A0AA38RWT4_9PEZI|nr:Box C/D snoRNA protein 1 [Pleurostoma richardsiae]